MDSYMSIFIGVKRLEFEILFFFGKKYDSRKVQVHNPINYQIKKAWRQEVMRTCLD